MRTQLKEKKRIKTPQKSFVFLAKEFSVRRKKKNQAVDDQCLPFAALSTRKKKLHRGQTM
jgi:hypothetical protein